MFRYRLSNDSMPPSRLLSLVYRNFAQQPEIAEHAAGAQHHRGQRIVGDRNRQPGLFANALVQILEHGAAAGEHDSAVADIRAEFGRSAFQGHADGIQITATHSERASRISASPIVMVRGTPSIRLRPLISMVSGRSSGNAEPISILMASAVRSPISRLYLRLRNCITASSISLPATRTDRE